MTALVVLPLVAIITLCAVYLFVTADAALDRRDWARYRITWGTPA